MLCLGQVKFWPPKSAPFLSILDSIPGDQRDICFRAVASGFMVRDLCPAFVRCCPNLARRLYRVCRRSISMYASHRRLQTFCVSLSSMRFSGSQRRGRHCNPTVDVTSVAFVCGFDRWSCCGCTQKDEQKEQKKEEIRLYSHTNSREWIHDPWSVPGIRQVLSESGQSAFSGL